MHYFFNTILYFPIHPPSYEHYISAIIMAKVINKTIEIVSVH